MKQRQFCIYISFTICIFLLTPRISVGSGIILKPMSLRDGIESQISLNWPLEDQNSIFSSKYYEKDRKLALEAGLDLSQHLHDPAVAGYNPKVKKYFLLFYNMVEAQGCSNEYLIQRVKLKKVSYNSRDQIISNDQKYLVEAMKIKNKSIKRSDRHVKKYSLNKAYRRSVFVDIEIGCGRITNITPSNNWPFAQNNLYKLLQNYSSEKGLYNKVDFEFSKTYSFSFEFSQDGNTSVEWPEFISNQI